MPQVSLAAGAAAGLLHDRYRVVAAVLVALFCASNFAGSVQKMRWKQQPMENFRAAGAFVSAHAGPVYALVDTQKQAPLYRHMAAFYLPPGRSVGSVTAARFGKLQPPYFVVSEHKSDEAAALNRKWHTRVFTPEQKNSDGVQVLYRLKPARTAAVRKSVP